MNTILLIAAGFIASVFGSLVGGAAFITIPVMIFMGVPLTTAISSNAFSNIGLNIGGFAQLRKKNIIHYKVGFIMALFAFIGSVFGSQLVISTPEKIVTLVFVVALILVLLTTLSKKNTGLVDSEIKHYQKRNWLAASFFALVLGAYSGFLGAGVGTFYSYGLAFLFGQSFLQSTATKKIPGLTQAFGAWLTFSLNSKMNYSVAIPLLIGLFVGAEVGIYFGLKFGNRFIRILLLVITLLILLKFLI